MHIGRQMDKTSKTLKRIAHEIDGSQFRCPFVRRSDQYRTCGTPYDQSRSRPQAKLPVDRQTGNIRGSASPAPDCKVAKLPYCRQYAQIPNWGSSSLRWMRDQTVQF